MSKSWYTIVLLVLCFRLAHQLPVFPSDKELQERYGDALEAVLSIAVRLQALLEDPDLPATKNFLISPLSVALIVGQLMLGAEGRFRKELYNLLSLPEATDDASVIRYYGKRKNATYALPYSKLHLQLGSLVRALEGNEISRSFNLTAKNALFTAENLTLKEEFLRNLELYDTDVQPASFASNPQLAMEKINEWASTCTNGVIEKILEAPLPQTTAAIFSNAIYFKAEWETPFSYLANTKGPFWSSKNETVQVEYMRGFFEDVPYAESKRLKCRMIAFPYKNNELSMYFMLPNKNDGEEYDIKKFADKLKTKDVLEVVSQLKRSSVSIQMPKMKLSNNLSTLRPLQRYYSFKRFSEGSRNASGDPLDVLEGRVDEFTAFNGTSNREIVLTGAAEHMKFRVGDILQQMTLSVDEIGTEAAAVSLSDVLYMGSKTFRIDRPFVFFIRHEMTSAVLFWGTITDPSSSE